MSTLLCVLGIALAALGILDPGIPGYVLCIAGFALCVLGGFLGGRLSVTMAGMVFSAFVLAVLPDGMAALVKMAGGNPARFFKLYDGLSGLIGALTVLALTLLIARSRSPRAHETMLGASDDIDRIVNGAGKLASWLFVPMMLVIFYDVGQRQWLNHDTGLMDTPFYIDSTKLQELEWHLHATLFLLCLGFAYRKDAHVRIELVRDRLSQRARVWMELAGIVFFLLTYCYLIVEFGWVFSSKSHALNEVSAAQTGLPYRWIIKAMLPAGFALLFAAGISGALRCLVYLFGPSYLHEAAGDYAGTHHADLPDDVKTNGPITD